jgi:hypothetical protein
VTPAREVSKPKVHKAGPTVLNAVVIFAVIGQTSSAKPMKKVPSHRANWRRRITAACPAASRSRSSYLFTGLVISRNATATTRSTRRVR